MIKVLVNGALGKMGRTTCDAVMAEEDMTLAAAVDTAFADPGGREAFGLAGVPLYESLADGIDHEQYDVAVDFTTPSAVFENVTACLKADMHCVVGTTGMTEADLVDLENEARAAGRNCFLAPNFAIGAVLMMEVSMVIARYMPHCEIIELHHNQKLDAPSGTSLRTAELIDSARVESPEPPGPEGNAARGTIHKGIPIHSVRLPGLVAHQEVIFGGQGQTLSLRHDSISRDSFMPGVVLAVRRVADLEEHLVIGLEKIM
ncbi:MAG: 4-hydroxy-tetrahydrodipicolinate reductase [Thermoleophilia bacterium]|nr:4-hydroxy-tetrahydrodipicolinate reductase [Thermoleophilia bacterium]